MIDFSPLVRLALLLVRPGMVVLVAPTIGGQYLPVPVKIGLTVLLAIGLMPSVIVPPDLGGVPLSAVVAREVAVGLALAFVVRVLVAGAEFAGHLSGFQIGFSYGATIDPQSGVSNQMLAILYGSLATLGLFAINGHHEILRALAASYTGVPLGAGAIADTLPVAVRDMLGLFFNVGVRLAAPVVIVLLLVELVVGLIARTQPALSYMVIGYPIRLIVGLTLVAALVGVVPAVVTSTFGQAMSLAGRAAAVFR